MVKKTPLAESGDPRDTASEDNHQRDRRERSTGILKMTGQANGSPVFSLKLKKPMLISNVFSSPIETAMTSQRELDLIMSKTAAESSALLPTHMNPSEPFSFDDYENPTFETDPDTGLARSMASIEKANNYAATQTRSTDNFSTFKVFQRSTKQNDSVSSHQQRQIRTPASIFWASNMERQHGRDTIDAGDEIGAVDPSESTTASDIATHNNSESPGPGAHTAAFMDPNMTSPLHEASRLGCAELVRLMLSHPFAEPNFKNGQNRTALHMVAGGWTEEEERLWHKRQRKIEAQLNHKRQQHGRKGILKTEGAQIGISAPLPVEMERTAKGEKDSHPLRASKAVKVMGRLFNSAFAAANLKDYGDYSTSIKMKPLPSESQIYLVWDEKLWNTLRVERLDCLLAVMSWCHPDDGSPNAGEVTSINAVDAQGRTALHYAAELGREDICLEILSSFGAMLTIVDEHARTPCESAAEHNHLELAARLEARALLYSDPYGMDDELLAAVMDERQLPNDNELKIREGRNIALEKSRMHLAAPFSWFQTLSMDDVNSEREERIAACSFGMMSFVKNKEEENELENLMYGMRDESCGDNDHRAACSDNDGVGNNAEDYSGQQESKSKGKLSPASYDADRKSRHETIDNVEAQIANQYGVSHDQQLVPASSIGWKFELPTCQDQSSLGPRQTRIVLLKKNPTGESRMRVVNDSKLVLAAKRRQYAGDRERKLTDENLSILKTIQTAHVAQFLSHHKWIVDNALAKFAENPLKAIEEAGVPVEATYRARKRTDNKMETAQGDKNSISNDMCLICLDYFCSDDGESWTCLRNCSHSFCKSCLGDYIDNRANSRSAGFSVTCPHHDCLVPMAESDIEKLSVNEGVLKVLQGTRNSDFIASAADLRFCPHPGCAGIVKMTITASMKRLGVNFGLLHCADAVCTAVHPAIDESEIDVFGETAPVTYEGVVDLNLIEVRSKSPPLNAHRFCFGCGDYSRHFPVSCGVLEQWNKKVRDEVQQVKSAGDNQKSGDSYEDVAQRLWMRANTRPCPKVSQTWLSGTLRFSSL